MVKLKPNFDKRDLIQELKHIKLKYTKITQNPYMKETLPQQVYQASYSEEALEDAIWILESRQDDFSIGRWNQVKDDRGYPVYCCSKCCHKIDFDYDFCPHCGAQMRISYTAPDEE